MEDLTLDELLDAAIDGRAPTHTHTHTHTHTEDARADAVSQAAGHFPATESLSSAAAHEAESAAHALAGASNEGQLTLEDALSVQFEWSDPPLSSGDPEDGAPRKEKRPVRVAATCPGSLKPKSLSAGRLSNLWTHIQACANAQRLLKRPEIRSRLTDEQLRRVTPQPKAVARPANQQTMTALLDARAMAAHSSSRVAEELEKRKDELHAALAELSQQLPMPSATVVSEPMVAYTAKVLRMLHPCLEADVVGRLFPSRFTIARIHARSWEEYVKQVRVRVAGKRLQAFLDGWTSPNGTPYIGMTLSWMERGHQMIVYPRVFDLPKAHTGANILQALKVAIGLELQIPFVKGSIVSVMADGGANMQAALKQHPVLNRVRGYCIIHNFLRALEAGDRAELKISHFFKAVRALVASFCTTATKRRQALENLQKAKGMKPLRMIQDAPTRWVQMYYVLKRLKHIWPALHSSTATELSMPEDLFARTVGKIRSHYLGLIDGVLSYLTVAEIWVRIFQQAQQPTISLISRFRAHIMDAFSRPSHPEASARKDADGTLCALEQWRLTIFVNLRKRLDVKNWPNGETFDRLCAAAEMLDARTVIDVKIEDAASSARGEVGLEVIGKFHETLTTAPTTNAVRPSFLGGRQVNVIESQLTTWVMDDAGHNAACMLPIPAQYMHSQPQYANLARIADAVLGVRPDTSMQERAFSIAKRATKDRPNLGGSTGGKLIALLLAAVEARRSTSTAPCPPLPSVPSVYSTISKYFGPGRVRASEVAPSGEVAETVAPSISADASAAPECAAGTGQHGELALDSPPILDIALEPLTTVALSDGTLPQAATIRDGAISAFTHTNAMLLEEATKQVDELQEMDEISAPETSVAGISSLRAHAERLKASDAGVASSPAAAEAIDDGDDAMPSAADCMKSLVPDEDAAAPGSSSTPAEVDFAISEMLNEVVVAATAEEVRAVHDETTAQFGRSARRKIPKRSEDYVYDAP